MKIVLAFVVLLGGIGLAMFFRRPSAPSGPPEPAAEGPLRLRQQSGPESPKPVIVDRLTAQIDPPDEVVPEPQPAWPSVAGPPERDPGDPPPSLARSYPSFSGQPPASGATPDARDRSGGERSTALPTTHEIVDGETLRGLAERYLGDADRYLEIYEANRDLLPSPEVLPIGARLRIPGQPRDAAPAERGWRRPLVPLRSSS